ncbi:MAG: protein-glutamate O-methyltransferase CheR [Cellulomonas sp.]|uniref:CheR family methyltransferase n=1 Tax=Cellulomonas sp. TaxID=40001 RepID=UPI001A087E7C|nr:protein-glutamate O-methyltransferase CheR [Cellulomonas sp.]MBF0689162.1 protein-glutamate O-methyltransferase CheR [Cellulomonas sp.]
MTISQATFAYVAQLVHERAGIHLEPGKEYLVESRLAQPARECGATDVDTFVARLRAHPTPATVEEVVEAMTTNETSWFRDVAPFDALREHVVPQVRATRPSGPLRIWSAACATGQEPYSIAMTLADLAAGDCDVLATDLSPRALERGREGHYTSLEMNRGMPAAALVRHFRRSGSGWQVSDALRSRVRFAHHNLLGAPPAWRTFDVVFLRNVLIYFDLATRVRVLDQVLRSLQPGGWLVLGSAETTLGVHEGFERVAAGAATIFRAVPVPAHAVTPVAALWAPGVHVPAVPVATATGLPTPRGAGPL